MRPNLPTHVHRKHPIVRQEYAVFTPPISDMSKTIGDWIDQRQPGGYIYSPSRWGKSRAVKWHIRSLLEERFGGEMPLHTWSRPADMHKSEGDFWRSIHVDIGHRYAATNLKRGERIEAISKFLISSAVACDSNLVVLIIDEAQDMSLIEWKWLVGLHNKLDNAGYRLCIFSVASHQMGYQYDLLGRSGYAHVAARFLVARWEFPGLTDADELEFVLKGYDEASEWPAGSGVSYVAHFAPEAYARGKRLATSSRVLWKVLDALLPDDYKGDATFPMKHVALAVEEVLFRVARGGDWEDVTSEDSWLEIVAGTGFSDHMRLVSAFMPKRRS